jgi:MFS family permease
MPAPSPGHDGSTPAKASAFAVPLLGLFAGLQAADPIINTNALVKASRALDMSAGVETLAASISTLALAATVMSTGLLADRLGRRRVLVGAVLVAIAGDVLVAMAPSAALFLAGRAVAGVGLGAVFAAAFAYLRVVTSPQTLARAVGIFSAVASVTMIILSFLGGLLATGDWRVAFLLVPVVAALTIPATLRILPFEAPIKPAGRDAAGQVLLALGVILFLVGASHAVKGFARPETLVGLLGGAALLAAFALVEQRRANAFFPMGIFRSPLFLAAIGAGFIYNFGMSITVLQMADVWQYVNHFKDSAVSLGQFPFFFAGIASAVFVGHRMSSGASPRTVILIASIVAGVGFFTMLGHDQHSPYLSYVPGLILIGAGVTAASVPYGSLVIESIGSRFRRYFGPVTSSRTTIGQFAYALGLAFSTVMIDHLTDGGVVRKLERVGVPPSQTGQGLDQLSLYVQAGRNPATALGRRSMADALPSYSHAFVTTMCATGALVLLAGLLSWWTLGREDPYVEDGGIVGQAAEPAPARVREHA